MLPGFLLEPGVILGGGQAAVREVEVLVPKLVQPLVHGPDAALPLPGGLAEEKLIIDAGVAVRAEVGVVADADVVFVLGGELGGEVLHVEGLEVIPGEEVLPDPGAEFV